MLDPEIEKLLLSFKNNYKTILNLEHIKLFLQYLGNPQNNVPAILIGGTNGKGQVATLLSLILEQSGYKTLLYTSPHLETPRERIRINNSSISSKLMIDILQTIKSDSQKLKILLSPFEALTITAILLSKLSKVDIAIFEVGLGGRLDATNVIPATISVITSVELDHTHILGESIEKIAREKAAIAKKGRPIIINCLNKKAKKEIYVTAKQMQAIPIDVTPKEPVSEKKQHCALLIKIVEELNKTGFTIHTDLKSIENIKIPGRFETVEIDDKKIILDVAHNPSAIENLVSKVKTKYGNKFITIFSTAKDKNFVKMLNTLTDISTKVILVPLPNRYRRGKVDTYNLPKNAVAVPSLAKAIEKALKISNKILITGSFYLVGPSRIFLRTLYGVPPPTV